MTTHLAPEECFAALEGGLGASRQAHLETCDDCRHAVHAARTFAASIATVAVPEPSPLFWDHFSARVRTETATADRGAGGWTHVWRSWVALGATAALVFVSVWIVRVPATTGVPSPSATFDAADAGMANGERDWQSVVELTADWSPDDLYGLAVSADAGVLVEDLTAEERAAFVQLLEQEMGVAQ